MGEHRPDAPAGKSDQRFPRKHRMRTAADFAEVYRHQHRISDDILLVFYQPNQRGHARLGLSVSRKVGNAVRRNQWKRWIREAFRRNHREWALPVDLIVIPRPVEGPTFAMVQSSLDRLVRRMKKRLCKNGERCD